MAKYAYQRISYAKVDELGLDPLRDPSFEAIQSVKGFTYYVIKESEEFNVPLIASNVYGNENYWWIIQIYNSIGDAFSLKKGTKIKIPYFGEVMTLLNDTMKNSSTTTIVEI